MRNHRSMAFIAMALACLLLPTYAIADSPPRLPAPQPQAQTPSEPSATTVADSGGGGGTPVAAAPAREDAAVVQPIRQPRGADGAIQGRNVQMCTGLADCAIDVISDGSGAVTEEIAGSVADSALKQISDAFANGTATLLGKINEDMSAKATPKFQGKDTAWFRQQYGLMFGLAITVTLVLGFASFAASALRGDPSGLLSTAGYVVAAVAITGSFTAFVTLGLQATDAFSTVMMREYSNNTREFLLNLTSVYSNAAEGKDTSAGDLALGLVLSLVTMLGAFVVFIILLLRGALLYGIVLFVPILFAAWVWPSMRGALHRALRWIAMLILVKFVMFTLLAAGAGAMASVTEAPSTKRAAASTADRAPATRGPAAGRAAKVSKAKSKEPEAGSFLVVATFGAGAIWLAALSPWLVLTILPIGAQMQAQQTMSRGAGVARGALGPALGPAAAIARGGGAAAATAMGTAARAGSSAVAASAQRLASADRPTNSPLAGGSSPSSQPPGSAASSGGAAAGGLAAAGGMAAGSSGAMSASPAGGIAAGAAAATSAAAGHSGVSPSMAVGGSGASSSGPFAATSSSAAPAAGKAGTTAAAAGTTAAAAGGSPPREAAQAAAALAARTSSSTGVNAASGARTTTPTGGLRANLQSAESGASGTRGVQTRPTMNVRPAAGASAGFIKGV